MFSMVLLLTPIDSVAVEQQRVGEYYLEHYVGIYRTPFEDLNPIGGEKVIEEEQKIVLEKPVVNLEYPEWSIISPVECQSFTQSYWYGHSAIDVISSCNDYDIYAVDNGTTTSVFYNESYGHRIEVAHDNGFVSTYSHLSSLPHFIVGQPVNKGDILGHMGTTGISTGVHLHFEVIYNGIKVDPLLFM